MSNSPQGEERLVIWANSNTSRGKFAAAAVHAALNWYGIDHRAVIVLGAKPRDIEAECPLVINDAGRTEVEPGTVTAGIRYHENAPAESNLDLIDLENALKYEAKMAAEFGSSFGIKEIMQVVKKHV